MNLKWKYYSLPSDDLRAKKQVLENFSMGSATHALTKRLTEYFANTTGSFFVIAQESLELEKVVEFRWAGSYDGGKQLYDAITDRSNRIGKRPIDGLVEFLNNYLQSSPLSVVLCEDWMNLKGDVDAQIFGSQGSFFTMRNFIISQLTKMWTI